MRANDPFDKFTEGARQVLSVARAEAQRLDHPQIGAEHLLLGIVRDGHEVAGRVLANLNVDLPTLGSRIESLIGRGEPPFTGEFGLAPRAKQVIELAVAEARRLNHAHVGTEHILLGLVREETSLAAGVLKTMGVDWETVNVEVVRVAAQAAREAAVANLPLVPLHPEPRSEAGAGVEFGAFTDAARGALSFAEDEARRLNHNYVGTEHLLLALVRQGFPHGGNAWRVLRSLGVHLALVRAAVEFIVGRGESANVGEFELTPRAKKVVALAVDESRRLAHDRIGTEHLLLGLIREGEGIGAGVLEALGVPLDQVRLRVIRGLESGTGPASGGPAAGEPAAEGGGPDSAL